MSKSLCPKCNIELTSEKSCTECGGVLTGLNILSLVCPEGFLQKCFRHAKEHGQVSSKNCPTCTNAMKAVTLPDTQPAIELDFCLSCQSLWFDANELKMLPRKSVEEKNQNLNAQLKLDRLDLDKYYQDKELDDEKRRAIALQTGLIWMAVH